MQYFDNHSRFHSVSHLGCKWCAQMLKTVPHFYFYFVSMEQRRLSEGIDDLYDQRWRGFTFAGGGPKLSLKFLNDLRDGRNKEGLLCKDCMTVFWNVVQFKQHIEEDCALL